MWMTKACTTWDNPLLENCSKNCGGIIAVGVFAARAAPITVREQIADKQDCL